MSLGPIYVHRTWPPSPPCGPLHGQESGVSARPLHAPSTALDHADQQQRQGPEEARAGHPRHLGCGLGSLRPTARGRHRHPNNRPDCSQCPRQAGPWRSSSGVGTAGLNASTYNQSRDGRVRPDTATCRGMRTPSLCFLRCLRRGVLVWNPKASARTFPPSHVHVGGFETRQAPASLTPLAKRLGHVLVTPQMTTVAQSQFFRARHRGHRGPGGGREVQTAPKVGPPHVCHHPAMLLPLRTGSTCPARPRRVQHGRACSGPDCSCDRPRRAFRAAARPARVRHARPSPPVMDVLPRPQAGTQLPMTPAVSMATWARFCLVPSRLSRDPPCPLPSGPQPQSFALSTRERPSITQKLPHRAGAVHTEAQGACGNKKDAN